MGGNGRPHAVAVGGGGGGRVEGVECEWKEYVGWDRKEWIEWEEEGMWRRSGRKRIQGRVGEKEGSVERDRPSVCVVGGREYGVMGGMWW